MTLRNEAHYLRILLPILANQGIDVAIIDHDSTDGSWELYQFYWDNPVISIERLQYQGVYSQTEQLEAKQRVYQRIKHDWVIHHDADEILEDFRPGHTLRDAIEEAHGNGFNALNFDEFCFLPKPGDDFFNKDYHTGSLQYYFFEPLKNRLNRAWRRNSPFNNVLSGGHNLLGEGVSFSPVNHILRHYIVLSYEHAKRKYLNRKFGQQDLIRGWHTNRLNFTEDNLVLPMKSKYLCELSAYDSKDFRRDIPSPTHYWSW
jgi:hypothetical protein